MVFPATALPMKVEMDIAGVWDDITSYVYARDGVSITRGSPNESTTIDPANCSLTLNNRDGRFSPRNPVGAYYGLIGRNTPLRVSVTETAGWLQIQHITDTTTTPTYVSTPDAASLGITGDVDLRCDVDLESWIDVTELVGKWGSVTNQRSYSLGVTATGHLRASTSSNGTLVPVNVVSTIPVPITQGRLAVRATVDVNNGAAGNTVTFYTAPTSAGSWTQLGQPVVTAGTTSIFASTALLRLLDDPDSTFAGSITRGKLYSAQVYNGIGGTLVANPDFSAVTAGASSFADSTGKTWTLTGLCEVTYQDVRFIGELSAFPQKWDTSGSDVWSPVVASGPMRRLLQGSSLGSSLYRALSRDTAILAYWPMEDEENATAIGSATSNTKPILLSSSVVLSTFSSFDCSQPIPKVGTSPLTALVPTVPSTGAINFRFLLSIPTGGLGGGSIIATCNNTGTAARWDIIYGTGGGGTLRLRASDTEGTILVENIPATFNVDGTLIFISVTVANNGANIDNRIDAYTVGDETPLTIGFTLAGAQVGRPTKVTINPNSVAAYANVALGHLAVSTTDPPVTTESIGGISAGAVAAWANEVATVRIKRLCGEEGVEFSRVGGVARGTTPMGIQTRDTLLKLLQDAATSDGGILFESRDFLTINYRPRDSLVAQSATLALDYSTNQLDEFNPTEDDQLIKNDVTVSRAGGGSARQELTSGALSTDIPPVGVGRYDATVTISAYTDDQLPNFANWLLHLGTVDEARVPTLSVRLESSHLASVLSSVKTLDLGDRVAVSNPPAWLAQETVNQMVMGYTEELNAFERRLTLNCAPYSPWNTGVWGEAASTTIYNRYANAGCVTTEALDTTETGVDVLSASVDGRWTTTASSWPFNILIGGELMTVTAVSGTVAAQTLTVTRSVNGVVKSHLTGAAVQITPVSYYAL